MASMLSLVGLIPHWLQSERINLTLWLPDVTAQWDQGEVISTVKILVMSLWSARVGFTSTLGESLAGKELKLTPTLRLTQPTLGTFESSCES